MSGRGLCASLPKKPVDPLGNGLQEERGQGPSCPRFDGVSCVDLTLAAQGCYWSLGELVVNETRMWIECQLTNKMKGNTTDKRYVTNASFFLRLLERGFFVDAKSILFGKASWCYVQRGDVLSATQMEMPVGASFR